MNETRKNFNNSQFLIYKNLLSETEASELKMAFQKFKNKL
jgi:hypothetical protein